MQSRAVNGLLNSIHIVCLQLCPSLIGYIQQQENSKETIADEGIVPTEQKWIQKRHHKGMGAIVFYSTIHTGRRQISKKKFVIAFTWLERIIKGIPKTIPEVHPEVVDKVQC